MPSLYVLAGPNGAGKTTFGPRFISIDLINCKIINPDHLPAHLYDKLSGDIYRAEKEENKLRYDFLKEQSEFAINNKMNFAYECNLRNDQVDHIGLFHQAGYQLHLIFMYLENIQLSIQRVKKRVSQKGLYIPDDSIRSTYYQGLQNLDNYYDNWDYLYIINNNKSIYPNRNIEVELILRKGKVAQKRITNLYKIKDSIPKIYKLLNSKNY